MRAALLGEEEPGAEHRRVGPRLERRLHVALVGDVAGEEDGQLGGQGGPRALEQLERGDRASHVATGLDTLDDDAIGARRVCRARLVDRSARVKPESRDPALRGSPEGDDDVGPLSDLSVLPARERK